MDMDYATTLGVNVGPCCPFSHTFPYAKEETREWQTLRAGNRKVKHLLVIVQDNKVMVGHDPLNISGKTIDVQPFPYHMKGQPLINKINLCFV